MNDNLKLVNNLIPSVLKAGDKIMKIYYKKTEVDFKLDGSPVTEADRLAEKILLSSIKKHAPKIPIVSEENLESHQTKSEKLFFLVDPLDGTKEFLKNDGKGSFTVNVALIRNGNPVFGIVNAPALGRLFYGIVGYGSFEINKKISKPIKVRKTSQDNLVAVASSSHRDVKTDGWLKKNKINKTISIGSSLKFCLLASGEADVYPRFGPTMEWDTAAGDAVLRSAGGKVLNIDGTNFFYGKKNYKNGDFIAKGDFD